MKKSLKKLSLFLFCLSISGLVGQEILQNKDFRLLNSDGTPKNWELRGGAASFKRSADGTVTLTRKTGAAVMLIQNRMVLTPGKEYVFLADVKAPRGTDYTIYFEENNKGSWVNPGSKFRPGGKGVWEKASVTFTPENTKRRNRLLIRLLNNNSSLEIKNLQIISAEK